MMISLTDLLMTINSVFIIGLCVHYFKSNYKILDIETYNQVADICEEYTAMVEENQQLDDGGEGFFRECLEEDPEEEEYEEEEPEEEDNKSKNKSKKKCKKVGF